MMKKKAFGSNEKIRKLFILLLHVTGVVSLKRILNNRVLVTEASRQEM